MFMFGACATVSGVAAMLGMNVLPVIAAEDVGDVSSEAAGKLSKNFEASKSVNSASDEDLGVYDFKDNKTNGTFTVTKKWSDKRTNKERPNPKA